MKKFLIKISYTVLPVWLLLVGMVVYLWATNDNSGDLMRLGLIDGGPEYTDSILNTDVLNDFYHQSLDDDSLMRLDTCIILPMTEISRSPYSRRVEMHKLVRYRWHLMR